MSEPNQKALSELLRALEMLHKRSVRLREQLKGSALQGFEGRRMKYQTDYSPVSEQIHIWLEKKYEQGWEVITQLDPGLFLFKEVKNEHNTETT